VLVNTDWVGGMSPAKARAVLLALVLVAAALVVAALGIESAAPPAGLTDLDTYQRVVSALKAGGSYYPVLHDALLAGHYGTTSPLNWRTPAFMTFLSWFPDLATARSVLGAMTVVTWAVSVAYAQRLAGMAGAIGAGIVLALSLLAIAAPRAELSFEVCAGTLILLSFSAYGLGWRPLGVAAGVLALFVRELAGIYVLVCLGLALRERRWGEAAAWAVALVAYGALYLWHVQQAMALLGPADQVATVDWLQFGGVGFVLRTAAFNGVLMVLPHWAVALVLVVGLVGLKRLPRAAIATGLYLLLFLAYGRPENEYWGGLYAPLVAFGVVFAPINIAALWRAAKS
jgi:hypothetical protein